ncbi:serine protease [Mycobacterium sp. MYCO198283]|uniref:S1 family peptidase n=1 Tax=Mycobacterium sp. MYCO198283 TaxID=2883505 RepID=UPI001E599675|nr:serine protease [Mycobacterium sp. MYCO198283]MCG5433406.1 serine protease [Mycobacterium sp. MYCO198283]
MTKRLLALVMASLVGAAIPTVGAPTAAADEQGINERVKDSVVYVQASWTGWVLLPEELRAPGGRAFFGPVKAQSQCTAFAVDVASLATAGHCVDPGGEEIKSMVREAMVMELLDNGEFSSESKAAAFLELANRQQWPVEGKDNGAPVEREVRVIQPDDPDRVIDQFTTAQVVDFQPFKEGDNALLRVANIPPLKPLVVADKAPEVGEELTAVGFAGKVQDISDPSRVPQPSFKTGTASSQQVSPEGVPGTEINAQMSAGMSGGPTISNETGEVLGVNSAGFNDQSANFITDATTLRNFLQKNGVQLAEPEPPKSDFPWLWVIIGAVAVAVVLLVIGLMMVLANRRKKNTMFAPPGFGPPGGPTQPWPPTGGQRLGGAPPQWNPQLSNQPTTTTPKPWTPGPAGGGQAPPRGPAPWPPPAGGQPPYGGGGGSPFGGPQPPPWRPGP